MFDDKETTTNPAVRDVRGEVAIAILDVFVYEDVDVGNDTEFTCAEIEKTHISFSKKNSLRRIENFYRFSYI